MERDCAEKLFEENQKLVYAFLYRNYPTYATDEDVQQEMALELWRACLSYDEGKGRLSTLAYTFMRNRMRTIIREANQMKRTAEVVSLDVPLSPDSETGTLCDLIPTTEIEFNDWDGLYKACTPSEQCVLRGLLRGKKEKEIAEELQITPAGVSAALHRLRRKAEKWVGD